MNTSDITVTRDFIQIFYCHFKMSAARVNTKKKSNSDWLLGFEGESSEAQQNGSE
jgi:hypothetical protein